MKKTKRDIRKETLQQLTNQAPEELLKKSKIIEKKLLSTPEFKKAEFVMLYASKKEEVATKKIINEALRAGKRVALPRCTSQNRIVPKEIKDDSCLEKGIYGIYEPKKRERTVQPEKIDLFIVPGVAFDKKNNRLGRGKGYYDKFLKNLPPGKCSVGLAFDFQIVDNLPCDSHDIPVSKVITN